MMTWAAQQKVCDRHTAESLRAVILSFHAPRLACKSFTSWRPLKSIEVRVDGTPPTCGARSALRHLSGRTLLRNIASIRPRPVRPSPSVKGRIVSNCPWVKAIWERGNVVALSEAE